MVVYIFPIDIEKTEQRRMDARICEEKIKVLGLQPMNIDPTYREETKKVKRKLANGTEVDEKDSIVIVDPELGFKASDIVDDFSFGNGVTIGGVRLKNGRWVSCGFVVFDHADKTHVDNLITIIKNIFRGI
jgi:hypothetical protein